MWEPFIDSVVICTMTAITIIITGVYRNGGANGVQMTAQALKTVAPWFSSLLTLAVVLFAFSTMLSYSFYGKKAVGTCSAIRPPPSASTTHSSSSCW